MAVDYLQSPMNGFSFLKKIGVAPQLLAALQDGGWSIKLTAKKISIEKGTVQFTKELPLAVTQAVQANTLPPDQLVELSKAMTTQVTLALQTNVQLGALDPAGEQPLFAPVKTTTKDEMVAKVKAKLSKPTAVGVTEAFFSANAGLGLIDMIKAYRETFGVGLKEAKDAVEAWVAKNKPSVQVPASTDGGQHPRLAVLPAGRAANRQDGETAGRDQDVPAGAGDVGRLALFSGRC